MVKKAILVLITFIYASTTPSLGMEGKVIITIPNEISLQENEILPLVKNLNKKKNFQKIEIVFFYFSTGIEKMTYNGMEEISHSIENGGIKALVKFKKKNKLYKVVFIEAYGKGKKNLFKKFSDKLNTIFSS